MAVSLDEFNATPHETYDATEFRLLYQLYEEAQSSRIAHGERLRAILQGRSLSRLDNGIEDPDPILKAIGQGESAGAPSAFWAVLTEASVYESPNQADRRSVSAAACRYISSQHLQMCIGHHPNHSGSESMTRFEKTRAALLALVLLSATVSAQTQPSAGAAPGPAATPCANDPERHRFDFWIGEWDVTVKSGGRAGSSVIQSVSGGCALLENWTGMNGGHGKSLNAYNPKIRQWQQYWIGQDGAVSEFRTSKFDGKSLEFFARDDANPNALTRLVFTPLDSATVRQLSEASTDGGKSWTTQYDFYYHRKPN